MGSGIGCRLNGGIGRTGLAALTAWTSSPLRPTRGFSFENFLSVVDKGIPKIPHAWAIMAACYAAVFVSALELAMAAAWMVTFLARPRSGDPLEQRAS
jgi:hypothetical protein